MNKKHFLIAIFISAFLTLIIQFDLTRAIVFNNYLDGDDLALGKEDRAYYLTLINESSKGNWHLGSPFLKEWSRSLYLYPALNVNTVGFLKKVLDVNVKTTQILLDYGAVFILMVLILYLFRTIFRSYYLGYLTAIAFALFPRMLIWDRIISPQINFIPLLVFLIFYFSQCRLWKREVGLGITAGLLFYVYPYYSTFALVLLIITDAWHCIKLRRFLWNTVYKYFIIGTIISYYLVHLWKVHNLFYYNESIRRIGALYSRFPSGLYTQILLLFLLGVLFFVWRYLLYKERFLFFPVPSSFEKVLLGLVTSLVVLNQQIITGMQLEFNSHYLPVIIIFIVASFGIVMMFFLHFFSRYKKFIITGVICILGFFVFNVLMFQIRNDSFRMKESFASTNALGVFHWFKENHINNKTIYAPPELGNRIMLLTDNYLFFHPAEELHLIPTSELIDRFTYFDITNSDVTNHPEKYQLAIFGQIFNSVREKDNVIRHLKAVFSFDRFVPIPLDSRYLHYDFELMKKKRMNITLNQFSETLHKYNVDYVVYSKGDEKSVYGDISGRVVFSNESYLIKAR